MRMTHTLSIHQGTDSVSGIAPVAIVTGAAGGIGGSICERLYADGFRLAVTDVDVERLDAVADQYDSDRVAVFAVDLLDEGEVVALPERVRERFGRIDVLVNNAGARAITQISSLTGDEWRSTLEVNLVAPALLATSTIQIMKLQGNGRIVNIASLAGISAFKGRSAYGASKAGLESFTRSIAIEYGAQGIRANAIAPGMVQTAMQAHLFKHEGTSEHVADLVPNGTPASPENIASTVSFLANAESDYLNGTTITIDGGWSAGQHMFRL